MMNLSEQLLVEARDFYKAYRHFKDSFFSQLDNDVCLFTKITFSLLGLCRACRLAQKLAEVGPHEVG